MSDTPRTDSTAFWAGNANPDAEAAEFVKADFARQLERELVAMTQERDALRPDALRYRRLRQEQILITGDVWAPGHRAPVARSHVWAPDHRAPVARSRENLDARLDEMIKGNEDD